MTGAFNPFAGPEILRVVPATEAQKEIWLAAQLGAEASCAYNESVSLTLKGALNPQALQAAANDLVARHEALRGIFTPDGAAFMITAPEGLPVRMERIDRSRLLAEEVGTPFDLVTGPLCRLRLTATGPNEHVLVLTAHHIICDGWSMAVLLQDLGKLYAQHASGTPADLSPAFGFGDYAQLDQEHQSSSDGEATENYWVEQFKDDAPVLDLPTRGQRPAFKSFASRREDYVLDDDLIKSLKKFGAKAGCSVFTVLTAAFEVLLSRVSRQHDIVVGVPAAGQSVIGEEFLVGHCVNLLPIRARIDTKQSFSDFLLTMRQTVLDAYDHQRYTFGSLLKRLPMARDPSRSPLVSVLFNVDQGLTPGWLQFHDLQVTYHSNPRTFENFELFINATTAAGPFVLECQYHTELFDADVIKAWLQSYEAILRAAIEAPATALGELRILNAANEERLTKTWNAMVSPYPREQTVHGLFERQVAATPDKQALLHGSERLTYAELNARANRLAHHLRSAGVGAGDLVGLSLPRTPEMVVAMLAILKAGGAYVPLDPSYPAKRLAFMIEEGSIKFLVGDSASTRGLQLGTTKVIAVDTEMMAIRAQSDTNPSPLAARDKIAYVIFTSGSTGKPKGVMVPHGAVVNFLTSMAKEPGLAATDVLLAVTTISFDIAVLEIYLPLTLGATLVVASRDDAQDGSALKGLIDKHGATIMQATPATWRLLIDSGWRGQKRFKVLCGGEPLPRDLLQPLLDRSGSVWNMYGPTETTVWSTCQQLTDARQPITIGKPIANTSVLIVDDYLRPVPLGVAGELLIGGDGVTHGYLNRPDLTAEKFIDSPYVKGKVYRTGDLARYLPDGTIECLGRTDFQVKVRGFRIELGEIEAVLAQHPDVRQAAVAVHAGRGGIASDARLVGYVVTKSGGSGDQENFRQHLLKQLPEYMVPAVYVMLSALPLTPNGKVDRRALPQPEAQPITSAAYKAPTTPQEIMLAAIWQDLLGLDKISTNANFFALGGHSLLAAQTLSRLLRDHGVTVPLRAVFEHPTVARLAPLLATRTTAAADQNGIPRRADQTSAPLSSMQQRVWYLEHLDPGKTVYNLPSAFRITGSLNRPAWTRALNNIVKRHDALRTTLATGQADAIQTVSPFEPFGIETVDLTTVPANQREGRLMDELHRRANTHIDMATGPIFHAALFAMSKDEHVFFFMPHHVIFDGWSFDVFLEELSTTYAATASNDEPDVPELKVQYGDFAAWQRESLGSERLKQQAAFWRQKLQNPPAALELATDKPRPAVLSHVGATAFHNIPRSTVERLTAIGHQVGATFQMVLLAAFKTLLYRYSGQDDILVGTPIRGRARPETEKLLGFFVNTLVLRSQIKPGASFTEFLSDVRTTCLDAYSNDEMPFELLINELKVARDPSRTPLFQAFFTFQDVRNRDNRFGDLTYKQVNVHPAASPTDISFWAKETHDDLVCGIDYATDLFEPTTIARFFACLATLLDSIAKAPETPLERLNILPVEQRHSVLETFNSNRAEFPQDRTIHGLIEEQVRRTPDAVAIIYGDQKLSYRTIDQRANRLARQLRAAGVTQGCIVGLCLERTDALLVAMLAIFKAGGAYLPLDPSYPADRLAFMISDSQMRFMVATEKARVGLNTNGLTIVDLERDAGTINGQSEQPLTASSKDANPRTLAYIIYTSGSTGRPKGTLVPHHTAVNLLYSLRQRPGMSEKDVLLTASTFSFDITIPDFFLTLSTGATMVIAPRDATLDGALVIDLMRKHQVNVAQATPSTWRMLIDGGWPGNPNLRLVAAGEALPKDLADTLGRMSKCVWNGYGPTETTVYTTFFEVPPGHKGPMYIGRPIHNVQVYILDKLMQPVPIGVPGEIFIGGAGVTDGYLNRPELTAERFVPNPFDPAPTAKLYRSGDLGRFATDGNIEYWGRNDHQVKVRGFRIELGEIENALAAHPALKEVVVNVHEEKRGDVRLVAYFVPKARANVAVTELRKHLRADLPDYMIPQMYVEMESMPLSPNGKVDRRRLPKPEAVQVNQDNFVAPRSETEKVIAEIWQGLLNMERVGVEANFFDLGGHSLLSMQMLTQVEQRLGVRLSPLLVVLNSLEQIATEVTLQRQAMPPKADKGKSLAAKLLGRFSGGSK